MLESEKLMRQEQKAHEASRRRRTKKQIAADMLAHQRKQALAAALATLAEAFAEAELQPPILAMTRLERGQLSTFLDGHFYLKIANNFGWSAQCAGVDIIERRRWHSGVPEIGAL